MLSNKHTIAGEDQHSFISLLRENICAMRVGVGVRSVVIQSV